MVRNDTSCLTLTVGLENSSYPIHIGQSLLNRSELFHKQLKSDHVLIVSNVTVAPLYLARIQQHFIDIKCDVIVLEDGETHKNQHSLSKIYHHLIDNKHPRDTLLISLGGGVIGDLTGFAASCYQRGVDFIQVPTTLLAQVDASVGGKTAINFGQAKNMIGSFYQPKAVIIDLDVLTSLPDREFNAGLAEVIKVGLVADISFFEWLEQTIGNIRNDSIELLSLVVNRCCQIKAQIVEQDERETGIRALLNLGHTFAHAFEAITHYKRWLHGEAVAIGLVCAARLSLLKGYIKQAEVERIISLISKAGLPTNLPADIDINCLIDLMGHDKKVMANKKRFVLMRELGAGIVTDDISNEDIESVLISVTTINDIEGD